LQPGQTSIPLRPGAPTQHLIVWLTKLSEENGQYGSDINEVKVSGAAS
jgi:hypothetical protein